MTTWRALVPPLLEWMTPRLTRAALHPRSAHVVYHAESQAGTRLRRPVSSARTTTHPDGSGPAG
jgi:hypothetical protein